jgi:hypothetical protein
MSCCGKGRMQASRASSSRAMARPKSPADRGEPRRRIARFELLAIPATVWAPGVMALVVWGLWLWAIVKTLYR